MSGMRLGTRELPAMPVVTETAIVDQAALEDWLPGAMARAAERAAGSGGALTAAEVPALERDSADPVILVVYEGNPNEGPCEVVVAVPVRSGDGDRVLPAHRERYARVTKGLVVDGRLGEAYEASEREAGATSGPPREVYWTDFWSAAPDDEVFDVAWPLA